MNTYTNHADWIESISPDVTVGQAERRIGLSKAALRRQMERNDGRISSEYVIRIAIEYNLNPAQALVDTGWLPADALNYTPTPAEKRRMLTELLNEVEE